MSDMQNTPGTNPPRYRAQEFSTAPRQVERDRASPAMWALGALGALVALALMFWLFVNPDDRTVTNPAPTTTGQSDRAPMTPLPANPSGTTPQQDPAVPAQR
jgi:hypothetical protein